MLRKNLVAQWQMSTLGETGPGPIQIWWLSGKCRHLQRPARPPYKFGTTVADGSGCENLPRSYTNLVTQRQMAAVVRICLDPIQIW